MPTLWQSGYVAQKKCAYLIISAVFWGSIPCCILFQAGPMLWSSCDPGPAWPGPQLEAEQCISLFVIRTVLA